MGPSKALDFGQMRGVEVIRLNPIGYLAGPGSLFSKLSVVIGPEKPKDI